MASRNAAAAVGASLPKHPHGWLMLGTAAALLVLAVSGTATAAHQYIVSFDPPAAGPGKTTTANFEIVGSGTYIEMRWGDCDGTFLGSGTSDASQTLSLTISVPTNAQPGITEIWECGGDRDPEPIPFRVLGLEVQPSGGAPNTLIQISGSGWLVPNEGPPDPDDIEVDINTIAMEAEFDVDQDGDLAAQARIPEALAGGLGEVSVCAAGVGCAEAFFTVTPTVSTMELAVLPGSSATLLGNGFTPDDPPPQWEIRLGAPDGPVVWSAFVDSVGRIEATVNVPLGFPEGVIDVSACRDDIDTGLTCYDTPLEVLRPSLNVDPSELRPSDGFEVSGEGWCCPEMSGTVSDLFTGEVWGNVQVRDETGSLTGTVTVPDSRTSGPVELEVCVGRQCRVVDVNILESPVGSTVTSTTTPSTTVGTSDDDIQDESQLCAADADTLEVIPDSGAPGTGIEVRLIGAEPSSDDCAALVELAGVTLGQITGMRTGVESTLNATVPEGVGVGRNALQVLDAAGGVIAATVFVVEGPTPPIPTGVWIVVGVALVAAAAGAFVWLRRPPPSVTSPTPILPAEVWPELVVPAVVEAGRGFAAEIRFTSSGESGLPMANLDVEVIADGYEPVSSTRTEVSFDPGITHAARIDLVPGQVVERGVHRIVAHIYRQGDLVGWAEARPTIAPLGSGGPTGHTAPNAAVPLGDPSPSPPDLTVTITRGDDERFLQWGFGSPHPIPLPITNTRSDLGKENARSFAKDEVVSLATTDPDLIPLQVRGIGAQIGGRIPQQAWELLTAVAPFAAQASRPIVVLIVSEEMYVPWELAAVPGHLRADDRAPNVLGAQMVVGRWMPPDMDDGLRPEFPRLPPSAELEVETMAVVVHRGGQATAPPLAYAADEAAVLSAKYRAVIVPAETGPVADLLDNRTQSGGSVLSPEIVHLTSHGTVDADHPSRSGIVLQSASGSWVPFTPAMIRGSTLLPRVQPVLFVNACSSGAPMEALDGFGGLVGAAIKSGATAIVAPLWEVEDRSAHDSSLAIYFSAMEQGEAVGNSLRLLRARASDGEDFDRASLAYVFFGHPWLKLRLAAQPAEVANSG